MKFKIAVFLVLLIIAAGAVSASENVTDVVCQNDTTADDAVILQSESDSDVISGNTKTFSELQQQINRAEANSTIEINGTYTGSGQALYIQKSLTISGGDSGAVLDARNASAILQITADHVTLKNIIFIDSASSSAGGSIYWKANNGEIINSTFINSNSKSHGGAVYCIGENMTFAGCTFTNCYCKFSQDYGGTLYIHGNNTIIRDCNFMENGGGCDYYAAAIYLEKATNFELSNSNFTNTRAIKGAVYVSTSKSLTIKNLKFINATNSDMDNHEGGALFFNSCNDINITNCEFINTSSTFEDLGTGVLAKNSNSINISDCRFETDYDAVYFYKTKQASIMNCEFIKAGVTIKQAQNTTLIDDVFKRINETGFEAIYFENSPYTIIINNTFLDMYAEYTSTITSHGDSSSANANSKIINCTFSNDDDTLAMSLYGKVQVIKKPAVVESDSLTFEYSTQDNFTITVKDKNTQEPLKNIKVKVNSNYYTTDENGEILIQVLGYDAGIRKFTVTLQSANYAASETIALNITPVVPTLTVEDVNMSVGGTFQLSAYLAETTSGTLRYYLDDEYLGSLEFHSHSVYSDPIRITKVGIHTIKVAYEGNGNYAPVNATATLNASPVETTLSIEVPSVTYGEETVITATVNANHRTINEGWVVFYIDGVENATVNVTDNVASLNYLPPHGDSFSIFAIFKGSENYTSSNATSSLFVERGDASITSQNLIFNKTDYKEIKAVLKDANANPIGGYNVTLDIDGKTFVALTNSQGIAIFNVTFLTPGQYRFSVSAGPGNKYYWTSKSYNLTVRMPNTVDIGTTEYLVVYNQTTITVKLNSISETVINDGIVKLYVNSQQVGTQNVVNGEAAFQYTFNTTGEVDITAEFVQSELFDDASKTVKVDVCLMPTKLISEDLVFNQGDYIVIPYKLVDLNDVEIQTEDIWFDVYDSNGGWVNDTNNLKPGEYTYKVFFGFKLNYESCESEIKSIIVKYATSIEIAEIINSLTLHPIEFAAKIKYDGGYLDTQDIHYFINGEEITANFTPSKTGNHTLTVVYGGDNYHTSAVNTTSFNVGDGRQATVIASSDISTVYNGGKYLKAVLKTSSGQIISNTLLSITLNGVTKKLTTNKNGEVSLLISQIPKKYVAKVVFGGDASYKPVTKSVNVVVKKATPKLTAKYKTFKKSVKTKKYTIILKTNQNKAMNKITVSIKVNGKTYSAKTNNKGVATFKITKLSKKGKFNAVVKFAGNKYYNSVTKKVKISVK